MRKRAQRRNGHMTGMQGVYLVAAELTKRGFIVSPTSRSAFGADLLVTDERCRHSWSVQVKANHGRPRFWLLNKHSKTTKSNSHLYVFVNLCQQNPRQLKSLPDFYVVPSHVVAKHMLGLEVAPTIQLKKIAKYKDRWIAFQEPHSP